MEPRASHAPAIPIRLHCLGGKAPPPELVAGVLALARFPAAAQASLWDVLGPCLAEAMPEGADATLERFRGAHDLDADLLARTIRALRLLVREAAARDLGGAAFAEDLAALTGGDEALAQSVLIGYEAGKRAVRAEILRITILEHGKLVERVDWRVDYLGASNHGERLRFPVALLTLSYREGDERSRITLHLTPEKARELRAACDKMLA